MHESMIADIKLEDREKQCIQKLKNNIKVSQDA